MIIKQISVFLENRSGRLHAVAELLGKENINIRSMTLADAADYGVLRFITDSPEKAVKVLRESGIMVSLTDVIAVEIPDKPGGFASITTVLDKLGIDIDYMYSFVEKKNDNAIMIFRFEDAKSAAEKLIESGVTVLQADEVLKTL